MIEEKYEHEVYTISRGANYAIFEVKNNIIYDVLDSLLVMIPTKIYSDIVFELSFDTLHCGTNRHELVFNLLAVPLIGSKQYIAKLYERMGDGGFVYKDIAVLVHCFNNKVFNDYFVDQEEMGNIYFKSGILDFYMEEPYKENKILTPFTCCFRVKLVNKKIAEITSNCDSVPFKRRIELFELYGYQKQQETD